MRRILSQVLDSQDVREIDLNSSEHPGFGMGIIVACLQAVGKISAL